MKETFAKKGYNMDNEFDLANRERNIRMKVCRELAKIREKEKK